MHSNILNGEKGFEIIFCEPHFLHALSCLDGSNEQEKCVLQSLYMCITMQQRWLRCLCTSPLYACAVVVYVIAQEAHTYMTM